MKVVVVDIQDAPLFEKTDFIRMPEITDLTLLQLPRIEPLDGSIFRALPKDTTHLIMRLADRLGQQELQHLHKLEYLGLAFTGWWDKYFDADSIKKRGLIVTINQGRL